MYVEVKEAVLEPSSANRHSTELSNTLSHRDKNNTALFLYTDGGPDHNLTFLRTQLSLISLSKT